MRSSSTSYYGTNEYERLTSSRSPYMYGQRATDSWSVLQQQRERSCWAHIPPRRMVHHCQRSLSAKRFSHESTVLSGLVSMVASGHPTSPRTTHPRPPTRLDTFPSRMTSVCLTLRRRKNTHDTSSACPASGGICLKMVSCPVYTSCPAAVFAATFAAAFANQAVPNDASSIKSVVSAGARSRWALGFYGSGSPPDSRRLTGC